MATIYGAPRDVYSSAVSAATWTDNIELADGNAQSYTVPSDGEILILLPVGDGIYFRHDGSAAALPVGDITDGTASKPCPANTAVIVRANPGVALSMIRMGATEVNVAVWVLSKRAGA